MFHYVGVGSNVVGVLLGLERRLEDRIRVAVVGDHSILIAAERVNRGAVSVVCV